MVDLPHRLSEAVRTSQIQDEARLALAMQQIQLDDEAIEILESFATGPALELLEAGFFHGPRDGVRDPCA